MENTFAVIESDVLDILHRFLTELGSERAARSINIDSQLDRDLGIDSLARVELLHRVESHFNVKLPVSLMAEAESVRDIVLAIQHAKPMRMRKREFATALERSTIDPSQTETLIEVLQLYAENEPNRPHIYLQDENGDEQKLTYGDLYKNAKALAQGLIEKGIKPGETVAIMLPTSEAFFYSFMGILLAGAIPVPIYPPFRPDRIGEYAVREAMILQNAQVRILITFHKAELLSRLLRVFISSLKEVTTVSALTKPTTEIPEINLYGENAALIQYTSGSTSAPKGVLLSHDNLLANIRAYGAGLEITENDVVVSWLPLYHDMGLIGAWLGSFYHGIPVTILSPLTFLTRPEQWLWTIHYHRATLSAGPNFAYELCVRKIKDKDIKGLDLSSWRLAFNGAEAINPNTLRRFAKRFAPYGFKEDALFPVYGLAESSVALTFPPLNTKPLFDRINRETLEKQQRAVPVKSEKESYLEFVSCGIPFKDHKIQIVDEHNRALPERSVGHLQFQGPSAMQGYYRNQEETNKVHHDGWWDTGDLAYIADGNVYITGRKKDIIIKAGRNYYPEEIESTTAQVVGVRKGCVAAFGVNDPKTGTEKLIIVAETRETNLKEKLRIREEIIDRLSTALGTPPDQVLLVEPHTIPKTSSGKLRRSACKKDYVDGVIGKPKPPTWWQLGKLAVQSAWRIAKKTVFKIGKSIYTLYVIVFWIILILPAWIGIHILPRDKARKYAKFLVRLSFRCMFWPVKVINKEILTKHQPMIYIGNHSSYIDALIFIAILPSNSSIVAKKELATIPILSGMIKKLEYILVERYEFSKSIADANNIVKLLEHESVGIFPEGTFTYANGIRAFKLGAFKSAVESHRPICPISIKGARKILRPDSFLLRPGRLRITVHEPIYPKGEDWSEMMRLRNKARKLVAKDSGEDILNV